MKVFTIYGHGGDLVNVTWTICTDFGPFPLPKEAPHKKICFDWSSGFR